VFKSKVPELKIWWEIPICNSDSDAYNTQTHVLSRWFIAACFTSDREVTFQQQAYSKRFCPYIKVDDSRYFKKGNCGNSTPALFLLKKGGDGLSLTQVSSTSQRPSAKVVMRHIHCLTANLSGRGRFIQTHLEVCKTCL